MPDPRFRIRTLMIAVTCVGLGLAALMSPSRLAISATFSVTASLLLFALARVILGSPQRAFWTGFAVFGWGHLLLAWEKSRGTWQPITFPLMWFINVTRHGVSSSEASAVLGMITQADPNGLVPLALCLVTLLIAAIGGFATAWFSDRRPGEPTPSDR